MPPNAMKRLTTSALGRTWRTLLAAVAIGLCIITTASAQVVALGASNTYGKGVPRGSDFPAQLQAMLKARGLNVRVANAGINGDTTAGMLRRLNTAVPAGTRVVILQPGGNDRRKGIGAQRAGNIAAIVSQLKARGIAVIMLDRLLAGIPSGQIQPDGQHLTPAGYRAVAARLVPQVAAALGGR